jgi:hypothetical protein
MQLGFPIAFRSDRQTDFCAGAMRFDEKDRVTKLELRPTYFGISKVVLREFADAVFEHYKVRPTKVDDDVCFADVTCFRGTTLNGEKFLLLRIGTDVVLHVYR